MDILMTCALLAAVIFSFDEMFVGWSQFRQRDGE